MRGYARCTAGLALGLFTVALIGTSGAADDAPKVSEEVVKGVQKIADSLDKNPAADVSKDVADLKKFKLKEPMKLLKLRASGGFGIGPKAPTDEKLLKFDGIERKLEKMDDITKADLAKDGPAIQEAGNRLAAIAAIAQSRPPAKDDGKKKIKDWLKWSADMKTAGLDLAAAAKDKDPDKAKKAAAAASKSCANCHDIFRDDE